MSRLPLLLLFIFATTVQLRAQWDLKWVHGLGSTENDQYTSNVVTREGLVISIGNTRGNNGNFTGNHGNMDAIITAMNDAGTVLWNKVVGGTADDGNNVDIDTLTDGNILAAFTSYSNNGDVTGNHGQSDIVFKKYSPAGTLIWSKTIGGSLAEYINKVKATVDGGFIAIGTTYSNNSGDVGANHSVYCNLWVVKCNASGNIEWQKCYGGSSGEKDGGICPASDGGYFITGTTFSNDGDLAGLVPAGTVIGDGDIWLAKINATGSILWAKQIGGSNEETSASVKETGSTVYVTFQSRSANRDILANLGLPDIAIFKYSAIGAFIWKSMYAGPAWDAPYGIETKADGFLYLAALSYSSALNGTSFYAGGESQALVLKIDTVNGSLKWIASYGGNDRDFGAGFKIKSNGDFVISGSSLSTNFNYINRGNTDAVVFQVYPSASINGVVFIDRNNNGTFNDGIDKRVSLMPVETGKQGSPKTVAYSNNGSYQLDTDTGFFTTRAKPYKPAYYTLTPDSFQTSFTNHYQSATRNIQIKPVTSVRDLRVYSIPTGVARPNYKTTYLIIGYNVGTDTATTGSISWRKDSRVTVLNYSTPPTAVYGDSIVWAFSNFRPFDSIKVFVQVSTPLPPHLAAGDSLRFLAKITSPGTDFYPQDNALLIKHVVIGPLDPNEKINLNGNRMQVAEVQAGAYVNYVIHFQNVGTAAAFDVVINDTMSSKLQLASIEPLAASHAYRMKIEGNVVKWRFENINLPDSFSNEPGSHGFIAFRIKPMPTLNAGDTFKNRAAIYFDFNDPVLTTPNIVEIVSESPLPVKLAAFTAAWKEANTVVCKWTTLTEINVKTFVVQHSTNGKDFTNAGTAMPKGATNGNTDYHFSHFDAQPGNNYYRLKTVDIDGAIAYSAIQFVSIRKSAAQVSCIAQQGKLLIQLKDASAGKYMVNIFGEDGKMHLKKEVQVQSGLNNIQLPIHLIPGVYYLHMKQQGAVQFTEKIWVE